MNSGIDDDLTDCNLEVRSANSQQHSTLNVPNLVILIILTLTLVALIIAGILIRLNKKKYRGVISGIGTGSIFVVFFLALYSLLMESEFKFYNLVMFILNVVATIVVFVKGS